MIHHSGKTISDAIIQDLLNILHKTDLIWANVAKTVHDLKTVDNEIMEH